MTTAAVLERPRTMPGGYHTSWDPDANRGQGGLRRTFCQRIPGLTELDGRLGIALDASILDTLRQDGVNLASLTDTVTGITYSAPVTVFEEHGKRISLGGNQALWLDVDYMGTIIQDRPPGGSLLVSPARL